MHVCSIKNEFFPCVVKNELVTTAVSTGSLVACGKYLCLSPSLSTEVSVLRGHMTESDTKERSMKGCIAPKESDRTDLLDVFLYAHTHASHIRGQGIFVIFDFFFGVCFLYKAIYFYMSIIIFFAIGMLAVS